jgi:lipoprotein-releasing system permease protein
LRNIAFYIAKHYLYSRKGSHAVSVITSLAIMAMTVAVAAMFIVLSIFYGLVALNEDMVKDIYADLNIRPAQGKVLKNIGQLEQKLKQNKAVAVFSKTIDEKIYLKYGNNGEIASVRGIEPNYEQVNPMKKAMIYGTYIDFAYQNEVIMDAQLSQRLGIPVATEDAAEIIMPKAGEGIVSHEEDIFEKKHIFTSGVYYANQLNNYVVAPIDLVQSLLMLPKTAAYQMNIKLKNSEQTNQVKTTLQQQLGPDYVLSTKDQENAAFWKMINTEKLMIYLIFILVIFITTFNLAGAIIIIQLDKTKQSHTLNTLGMSNFGIRKVYFYTGMLIVGLGIVLGLILGFGVSYLQLSTGWLKNGDMAYPIAITADIFVYVTGIALFFGTVISWIFSKPKHQKQLA